MRQIKLLGILAAGFVILSSFIYSSAPTSTGDWFLGHFKTTVDLGDGDRPVYIHILNETDEIKTIMDNPSGIGCEDIWELTKRVTEHVFLLIRS